MFRYHTKHLPFYLVAGLLLTTATATADITTGLEVQYAFDNATTEADLGFNSVTSVNDSISGTGTLTQVAGPGGSVGNAANFGTGSDTRHIDVAGKSSPDAGSFTFAAWIKAPNPNLDRGSVVHGRTGSGDIALLELAAGPPLRANTLVRAYTPSQITLDRTDSTDFSDDMWHHMAGTWDGGSKVLRLYVDGVISKTSGNGSTGPLNISDFSVGVRTDGVSHAMEGSLADVRMYNRALSDSDVGELFNVVPEPSGFVLAALALCGLACRRRRRSIN